jgi:exodeoxyribonuclease-5
LNGVTCVAASDAVEEEGNTLAVNVSYEGRMLLDQVLDVGPFLGAEGDPFRKTLQMDYGYALTVHKSQGSQYNTVTLYDDGFGKREPETRRRWLYTAITRAEHQLYIVTS